MPGQHASPPVAAAPGAFRIIVNATNPVTEMHRAEVRDLFLKRRGNWTPELLALPVDLSPKLDVRGAFSKEILELSTTAVTTYWMQEIFAGRTEPPSVMSSVSAVLAYVAATPGAIAYIPIDTPTSGVRVVRITP
jgi:ABC-type phosphate transport system substrate-binding protein